MSIENAVIVSKQIMFCVKQMLGPPGVKKKLENGNKQSYFF